MADYFLRGSSVEGNAWVGHYGNKVIVQGGYGGIESESIEIDAKQALLLLLWLQQEKPTLERIAGAACQE